MTGTKISISSRSCPFPPGCWLNSVTHVVGHSDVWFLTVIRPWGRLLWCQSSGLVLGHQSCRLLLCSPLLQVWLSAASEPLLGAWNPIDCSSCLLWSLDIAGGGQGAVSNMYHTVLVLECFWGRFSQESLPLLSSLQFPLIFFLLDFYSSKATNWTRHFAALSHSCNSKDEMSTCFNEEKGLDNEKYHGKTID